MNLIGRYERIRGMDLRSELLGPPYMLDRKWSHITPIRGDEWWRSPDGIWIPTVAGGVGFQQRRAIAGLHFMPFVPFSTTFSTASLNSAYTAGSAGAARGIKWACPASATISNIYFCVTAYGGTAANVNDIDYEVRTGTISGPDTTGPGLVASGTKDPASATGWINISGLSVSVSAGFVYVIIADADGNGTDFATIRSSITNLTATLTGNHQNAISTTNGFSTTTQSAVDLMPHLVAAFSSGNPIGIGITASASSTSSTNRRGLYMSDGLLAPLDVIGWSANALSGTINGIELYDSSTNPGGTTLASASQALSNTTVQIGAILSSSYRLAANTPYRFVFTMSSSGTVPSRWQIGTGVDSNLRKTFPRGAGNWYWAEANGTTNWANDNADEYPNMTIWIEDQVTSGGLLINPGLSGGLR